MSVRLPQINWILRGFWGKYYQAPPLTTLSGPLLEFAHNNDLGFLPLHGERDEEYQFGVTIPLRGWSIDMDHFRTRREISSTTTISATRMPSFRSPSMAP